MNPNIYYVIIGDHVFQCSFMIYRLFRGSMLKEDIFDVEAGSVFAMSRDKKTFGNSQIIENHSTVHVMELREGK